MIVEGEVEEKGQKGRSIGSDFGGLRRAQFKILFNGSIKAAPPLPNTIQVYFINCQKWVVVGGGARGKGLKGAVKGVE